MKRLLKRVGLIGLGLALGLLVAEVALRLAGISYPNATFYMADPYTGVSFRPGASGWFNTEGHAFVQISRDGLRDREHSITKPSNTLRIAFLGDSFCCALQVSVDRTFWAVVEHNLGACPAVAGRNVEVIDFGVDNFGTAQELLMLRHRVWKYSPDVVVLSVTAGNDIRNNSRVLQKDPARPYFVISDGKLQLDDSFLKSRQYLDSLIFRHRVWMRLNDLRVVQVLREAKMWRAMTKMPSGTEWGLDDEALREPSDPQWASAWQVTDRLMEAMNEEVAQHGARLLIVVLTTGIEVSPDAASRESFLNRVGVPDFYYPDRRIAALGQKDGFAVLSLAPPLLAYARKNHAYLHGFRDIDLGHGHYNEAGHRLAGELISDKICAILQAAQTAPR